MNKLCPLCSDDISYTAIISIVACFKCHISYYFEYNLWYYNGKEYSDEQIIKLVKLKSFI